jgi:4-hydroxybenzoate polyprenyltransferase
LGIALMLAPISAWIALRAGIDWPPILLGLGVFFWVAGFDIIYACQDADFDRECGVYSIPGRFGVANALRIAAACHAVMIVALIAMGLTYPMGPIYFVGIGLVATLLFYEHMIVRPDDLTRVNIAFFQVNIAISMGLLAVTLVDLVF